MLGMSTDHITSCLTMTFLLRTLRDWFVTLEAIALQNPALFNTTKAYKNSNEQIFSFHTMQHPFFTTYRWKITWRKSYQLKEASVTDARATPPTIGTREPITQGVGLCQKMEQGITTGKITSEYIKCTEFSITRYNI